MPRTKEQLGKIKEQTRFIIMEAAIDLFADKGYHGTSISEIASKAGISKGLAYNYFESKEHLLESIIEEMLKSINDVMSTINAIEDPYEKINVLINNSFKYASENEKLWRLYIRLMFQPDIIITTMGMTSDFMKELFGMMESIFRKIGFKNAAAEARIFSATIDGLLLYYIIDPDNFPLNKVKKVFNYRYSKSVIENYLTMVQ